MRLWELGGWGGETVQWRTRVLELSIFPGTGIYLSQCLRQPSPPPHPTSARLCTCVSCPPELLISCVCANVTPPFPSRLPFFPFSSLPSLEENRTRNSLPLATYTHPALSFPRFLASADSLSSKEGGRRGVRHYPASLPTFLGIVL